MFFQFKRRKKEQQMQSRKMELANFADINDMETLGSLLNRADALTLEQLDLLEKEVHQFDAEESFYSGRIGRELLKMKETKMCNIILGVSNDEINKNEALEGQRRLLLMKEKELLRELSRIDNELEVLVELSGDHSIEGDTLLSEKRRKSAELNNARHTRIRVEQAIENRTKALSISKEAETLKNIDKLARVDLDVVKDNSDAINEYSEQLNEANVIIDECMPVNDMETDFQKYKEAVLLHKLNKDSSINNQIESASKESNASLKD